MSRLGDGLHQAMHLLRILLREWRGAKLEPEVPFMDRFLKPDALCLHIGASDGRHSLYLARRVPQGAVHCIEASPYTLGVLRQLVRLFSLPNLRLHNLAIGAADGETGLVTPIKKNGHRGRAFAYISNNTPAPGDDGWDGRFIGFEHRPVALRSLDSFCREQGLTGIDFLRCDIEGAEILMLDGGTETLARDRPAIMMEVHPIFLAERFGRSHEEIWQRLAALDYRIFYLRDGALAQTDHFLEEPWRDYFCVPAERLGLYGLAPDQPGATVAQGVALK